ncbi:ABC transporter permease [Celeribacter marinus]|uniref:Putative deoxyribose-specific ABC transporter, permease protein n=1 Tax=Celeribacter marinus TaxID=1397108 RepID=A0A0P0A801_9RHOB|nr:ABC transporter permease [Celeribacter marinus]ALI56914.1 putative deoxyribose-specific ABC transporter, permease protein [Celeribacter marinus]SFK68024.1 nucleoside ABC transporter membrane protein [Celeribacter marinus]
MNFGGIDPVILLASLMVASTPILLAALGEMVVEKSGVLNLGVEGMMITGAVCGFIASVESGSPLVGFIAAAAGGALLAMLFALLTQVFQSTQVPSGLALTLVGVGLASFLGQNYVGVKSPLTTKMPIPLLEDIPVLGPILFRHDAMVYFSLFAVVVVWAVLKFTRAGLILRAVGENHTAAHALGYKVRRVRVLAIGFGGAMAGLGGAYISLIRVPQWTDGITAGIGWIALAIVVFASWKAPRVLIGAYLFGGITVLQLNLQAAGAKVPVELLSMSPFLATIVVLVVISARSKGAAGGPAMLGRIFQAR